MSSTPEQCKRWRARYPEKVRAYRATETYRQRQNARRRGYNSWRLRPSRPWVARIKVNGEQRHLGMFKTEAAAHAAYMRAAREEFGEFARELTANKGQP